MLLTFAAIAVMMLVLALFVAYAGYIGVNRAYNNGFARDEVHRGFIHIQPQIPKAAIRIRQRAAHQNVNVIGRYRLEHEDAHA